MEAEELERQDRFQKLMNLLQTSEFYTNYLLEKMGRDMEVKRKSKKKSSKPTTVSQEENKAVATRTLRVKRPESSSPDVKRKATSSSDSVVKKKKKDMNEAYDIDRETIEKAAKESHAEPGPSNGCKEVGTRVTEFGHVVSERQPVLFEGGALRNYQLDALDWLKCLFENGINGILADEMGLGKTLEAISLLCHLTEMGKSGPYLIVAPLSTIPNWVLEFERFAPRLPVVVFHGTVRERRKLARQIIKRKIGDHLTYPVVITSYEIPKKEKQFFLCRKWAYMIIDEGHRLKNPKSQLASTLKTFKCANRLLLTGTPLQNSIAELWALLNFLLPEVFNDLELFESWIRLDEVKDDTDKIVEQEEKNSIVTTMHQILTPFLLRRTKGDVDISLPPKKEMIVYAPMTSIQRQLYESTLDHSINRLFESKKDPIVECGPEGKRLKRKCSMKKKNYSLLKDDYTSGSEESEEESEQDARTGGVVEIVDQENKDYVVCLTMQNPSQQLRKIVNHPYLIQMPLVPGKKQIRVDEDLVRKSGKLMVMDAMLAKLKPRGHKVLIFSTYVMVLDLLEEYMLYRKHSYCRLDGITSLEDRKDRIKQFNTDPNIFVFLISTRAGGLGINVTGADTVIIFDSDWNPQVDLQAQDRCHRIGQTKPVVVYRLVTAGTYDEKIVECANAKRKLDKLIIKKDRYRLDQSSLDNLMSLQELKELLNSSDQKTVQANGDVFTDAELEALLDRSDMMGGSSPKNSFNKRKIVKKIAE